MKKFAMVLAVVMMAAALMSACATPAAAPAAEAPAAEAPAAEAPAEAPAASTDPIKVGMVGCYTGDYAMYGLAVKNGAQLYIDQVNAAGGVNGKQIEVIAYDNKADNAEAVNAFSRMVDEGITALIGDVLTGNTLAVVGEAYPINMPMVTASATAKAVTYDEDSDTVYSNVFRTCFIDPFQGEKMAAFASEVLGAKTAACIYETGNDYAQGVMEAFSAKCAELGMTVVATEAYATGDKDFKSQMTNIMAASPDVVFSSNYYQDVGMMITQAREVGLTAPFLGGDGWSSVKDYASAEDLEGCYYCSGYAPGATDDIKAFEAAYEAAYGEPVPNMFAALSYDAAMVLVEGLKAAEATGTEQGSEEYKQAVIDGIRNNCASIAGITSPNGYTFDEYNNPVKDAVIMLLKDGAEEYFQMF